MQTFCIPLSGFSRAMRPALLTPRFKHTQNGALRCAPTPAHHSLAAPLERESAKNRCLGNKIRESVTASLSSTMQLQMALWNLNISLVRLKPKTNLFKPSLSNTPPPSFSSYPSLSNPSSRLLVSIAAFQRDRVDKPLYVPKCTTFANWI